MAGGVVEFVGLDSFVTGNVVALVGLVSFVAGVVGVVELVLVKVPSAAVCVVELVAAGGIYALIGWVSYVAGGCFELVG